MQVVMTAEHLCVTRPETDVVIERFDLLYFQGIGHYHPGEEDTKGERRGSNVSVEAVLQKAHSSELPDKPAFQFKIVDKQKQKRR